MNGVQLKVAPVSTIMRILVRDSEIVPREAGCIRDALDMVDDVNTGRRTSKRL